MAEKFRSLEGISSAGSVSTEGVERRRVPRLALTTEQFRLAQNGRIFSIADLSAEGMAIRIIDREDLSLFPIGRHFQGTINLKRNKYPVQVQVRHLGTDLVGCEFDQIDDGTQNAIRTFLDPCELGRELRPIPATDGVALWYHGPSGTDLLFWRHPDGQFTRLMMLVLGTFIQWEDNQGLSTGRLDSSYEQSEIRGVIRLETMLLTKDPELDPGKLAIAVKLISHSPLQDDLKKWCERHFDGP